MPVLQLGVISRVLVGKACWPWREKKELFEADGINKQAVIVVQILLDGEKFIWSPALSQLRLSSILAHFTTFIFSLHWFFFFFYDNGIQVALMLIKWINCSSNHAVVQPLCWKQMFIISYWQSFPFNSYRPRVKDAICSFWVIKDLCDDVLMLALWPEDCNSKALLIL